MLRKNSGYWLNYWAVPHCWRLTSWRITVIVGLLVLALNAGQGIRLLGRTAVECTRDALGNRIGRDIASIAATLPKTTHFTVIDPFAGSCNTLYWILRSVPNSQGMACEFDSRVYELTKRNIAGLDRTIDLQHGDYQSLLADRHLPPDHVLIFFIAPPWGIALDEVAGLDLRRTTPPVTDIIGDPYFGGPRATSLA